MNTFSLEISSSTTPCLCISGCAGAALVLSMVLSSLVGTVIPIFFKKVDVYKRQASTFSQRSLRYFFMYL